MKYKQILCVAFCCSQFLLAYNQTLTSAVTVPYADSDKIFLLNSQYYIQDQIIELNRWDLRIVADDPSSFSLTHINIAPDIFRFDAAFFEIPSIKGPIVVDKTVVPLVSSNIRIPMRGAFFSINMINGFIPELSSEIETQQITLAFDPLFAVGAKIEVADVAFWALYAENKGELSIEGVAVGDIGMRFRFLCGEWKNFGLFYAQLQGKSSVSAYARIHETLGFSILSSGNADIKSIGGWGKREYRKKPFSAELWSCFALYWTKDTFLEASFTYQENEKTKIELWGRKVELNPSLAIILRPSITWSGSENISIQICRWIPYVSGWHVRNPFYSEEEPLSPDSRAQDPFYSTIEIKTILLSGLEISLEIKFP